LSWLDFITVLYYIYAALGSHDYFIIQMPIMGLKHKFYQVWFRLLRELGSVCRCFEELVKTVFDNFHKLFSAYFHKFSNIAYKNSL